MRPVLRPALAFVFTAFFAPLALASDGSALSDTALIRPADSADLSEFVWKNRPLVVFADSSDDPAFARQIDFITAREDALRARDVVVLIDTDPAAMSDLRRKFRPRGFMLVMLDKDGRVQLRKPVPWSVRELSRVIDKLPIRQQEIRDEKAASGG